MRLKSLEVQGYKSFANKVEFVFDNGITAVVGPNGSGKSNVADAIRWVLGEQSYGTLRGKKTEDMIFSGSDGRARLGMANATLVLDNTDKWLPLDFSEVTIARRAYRSGENEYYLNGSRVRLRDITELLARSGLRRQTYTVVGQGMIDRVLSLHSDERRRLFEEAAGITFHRQQRADALSKLEATEGNLLRLNDIVKEIEPRVRRLQKQADRAEEYALIKTHLDGLLQIWYGYRWGQQQSELKEASARLHESDIIVDEHRAHLQELNRQIDAFRTEQTEARASLSLWYSENNHLNKQAEALQRELAVSEERTSQYAAQRNEILDEVEPLVSNLEAQQQHISQSKDSLQTLGHELTQAEEALRLVQGRLDSHQARQDEVKARQATAERDSRRVATELTQLQTRLLQLNERRETLTADQAETASEIEHLSKQREALQAKQGQLGKKLGQIETDVLALEREQAEQREALSVLNREAEQLKAQLTALSREEESLNARLDVLDKLRTDGSGYFAGVRAVLDPQAGLSGILGTVSQLVQVPQDLEVALEAALGGRLQDVVVETFAEAEAAITHLKRSRKGRATLLPLDTIRAGNVVEVPATAGVVGLASELVKPAEARLQPIIDYALNRTVVVDDLAAARRAFETIRGGFQIVTREGELMRSGGSVTGGRMAGKGRQEGTFLAREREWRTLPDRIAAISKKQETISGRLAADHDQANKLTDGLQQLVDQHRQKREQLQEVQSLRDKANRALEQLGNSLEWQQDLQHKGETELAQIGQRHEVGAQEMAQLQQAQEQAEQLATELAQEVEKLSAGALQSELNQAEAAVAALQTRHRHLHTILQNYQAAEQQLKGQIESKQFRAESLADERQMILDQQQGLKERGSGFDGQLLAFAEKIQAGEKMLAELEVSQVQLQHEESNLRQRVQRLDGEHGRLSLEAARCQDELDLLQRHIHEDLGLVQLEMSDEQIGQPVLPLVNDLAVVEELPPGVEEDVTRLKVQIRRLGSINPEAPREYAELSERHKFLTQQISDLEAAVTDLREVISKLDTTMQEAFTLTFQRVATEFRRYFSTLFGGGEAQLLLTTPDDLVNSGVDIVARPPGKRLQSMALLSGGERSLTAQALIFALLRISPTPFVIFDEVDAMLDEANVGRFRDALTILAQDIQFIVITHNRKTIEAANTLYGVSMGDDSVSLVYSLKIDDWLEHKPSQ